MKKTVLLATAFLCTSAFAQTIPTITDPSGGYVKLQAASPDGSKKSVSAPNVIGSTGDGTGYYHFAIKFDSLVRPGDNTDLESWMGLAIATNGNETGEPGKGGGIVYRYDSNSDTNPATQQLGAIGFGYGWGDPGFAKVWQTDTWYNVLARVSTWNSTWDGDYAFDLMIWEAGTTQPAAWDATNLQGKTCFWNGLDGKGITLVGHEFVNATHGTQAGISFDNAGWIPLSGAKQTAFLETFDSGLGAFAGAANGDFSFVSGSAEVTDWSVFE